MVNMNENKNWLLLYVWLSCDCLFCLIGFSYGWLGICILIISKIDDLVQLTHIVFRSSHPEVFLKGILKICSKFKRKEHPCRSVISIKLLGNFIEIALQHGFSHVNLLHIFRTIFLKNAFARLLLHIPRMEYAPIYLNDFW